MKDSWADTMQRIANENSTLLSRLERGSDGHSGPPARHTGTVKWFNRLKGHGFITADDPEICDGGLDVFVHYKHIDGEGHRNLYDGDRVSFTIHDFGKGPQARDVRRRT